MTSLCINIQMASMSHWPSFINARGGVVGIPETPPIPWVNYLYNHYKAAISVDPRPLPATQQVPKFPGNTQKIQPAEPGWMLFVNEAIWGQIGQHLNGYVRLVVMYIWLYIYIYMYIYIYCILYAVIWCTIILYINTYTYIYIYIYGRWWPHILPEVNIHVDRNSGRSWKIALKYTRPVGPGEWHGSRWSFRPYAGESETNPKKISMFIVMCMYIYYILYSVYIYICVCVCSIFHYISTRFISIPNSSCCPG